jgi:hypothetical protein
MTHQPGSCGYRLTTPANPALGVQQFTPTQAFFIETNAAGRWATDPNTTVTHTAHHMKVNDNGTVDLIALQSGQGCWYDMGGKGAYDVRAGRM